MSIEAMKLALAHIKANAETRDEHEIADGLRQAIAEAENQERKCENCGEFGPCCQKQEPVTLSPVQFEKVVDGIKIGFEEVADGIEIGYDIWGGIDIRLGGEFVYVHINYDYRYTHNSARKWLAAQIVGLLTHPPKRDWVGLTDEDLYDCFSNDPTVAMKNAEQTLKEKNT